MLTNREEVIKPTKPPAKKKTNETVTGVNAKKKVMFAVASDSSSDAESDINDVNDETADRELETEGFALLLQFKPICCLIIINFRHETCDNVSNC